MIFLLSVSSKSYRYHSNISTKAAMTVLAVVFFQHSSAKYVKYNCTYPDEFFYAVPGSRCKSYYKCNADRRITTVDCPPESIFDFFTQTCTRDEGICYEPVCAGRVNGLYQDSTHACRRSYTCRGGNLDSMDNCPHSQIHNGNICDSQNRVFCDTPQATSIAYPFRGDRRCFGLKDGQHVADNTDCSRFITCRNGKVINDIECAESYRYHENMNQCVPKYQVDNCQSNDHKLCKSLNNGLHFDPQSSTCQSFIKCQNSRFVQREYCGSQAVFNGSACVPKPLFNCLSLTLDLCKNKPNGLLADPRKGCGAYVRCLTGKTVDQLECPVHQFFDPQRKLCVYEHSNDGMQCVRQQQSSECLQLEMGYYQDKSNDSSCRNYFFCFNGIRMNYRCQSGTIFDGENCVEESSYMCPNQNPNSCLAKRDGYYKDERAGCRAYFYCSGGRKFRYVCGENQLFNGSTCVQRPNGHTCQNMNACVGKPDGYYPDATSQCRRYFFCLKKEVLTTLTCRGSKIYNGHMCVNQNEYTCPSGTNGFQGFSNCIPRSQCDNECSQSGFFADIGTGCVNYYFCIGDNKTVLTCKDGTIFNGDLCVPRELYSCPKYCSDIT